MYDNITVVGKIGFEPINKTKKHELQASWKRIAMVFFDDDITEYYAWFIKKRYSLELIRPIRGGHISFINDNVKDIIRNCKCSEKEANIIWESSKRKWDGVKVPITLDLTPRTNDKHWWLNIPLNATNQLDIIRNEVNLGVPNYRYHMTIGYVNEKWKPHSKYIHSLIKNGLIK